MKAAKDAGDTLFNLSENRGKKHDRINKIAVESGHSEEVAQTNRHPYQRNFISKVATKFSL